MDDDTPLALIMHHPRFGIALKERLDELGVECIVQYLDERDGKIICHPGDLGESSETAVDMATRRARTSMSASRKYCGGRRTLRSFSRRDGVKA